MIRFPDISNATVWARPPTAAPRTDSHDASSWFDGDTPVSDTSISGDLHPAARGLSVEQHAGRILMLLRGEADGQA